MNYEFQFQLQFRMILDTDLRPKVQLWLYMCLSATVSASAVTDKIGFDQSVRGIYIFKGSPSGALNRLRAERAMLNADRTVLCLGKLSFKSDELKN